ncbi:helix-turn-helix domain-containing protein [Fluviispira multicolorata]|uniref:HTH psq-type domain-containing protein n=1 Tax=Fluviispira multicolorata TaxID=2654512 RepID=A0A833JCQ6_9BACT|nr:helix-turn-helix domain-containing protein [Fluviispira multicolorata]KAB8030886.1 hypothetical protein GCL57_07885 [Fluviispira multicolorata]
MKIYESGKSFLLTINVGGRMAGLRSKLVSSLISKKLNIEIDQFLSISRQGFDIQIRVEYPEVEKILLEILEVQLKINSRAYRLIIEPEQIYSEYELPENEDLNFMPIIYVGRAAIKKGYGFITLNLPPPDQLISSIPSTITAVLNYFSLEIYLDVFDSEKLLSLKQIARTHGLNVLVDSVIQTAYLGGFKGESEEAQRHLNKTHFESSNESVGKEISLEKCAERFFSYVLLRGEDAHCFLKSSFSYYSIYLQGLSMSRASQILSISRTTLQAHLKTAEELGVSHFFEGNIQKSI